MKLHSRKVALVTGGTDGIGKEIARRLAGLGAEVGLVGRDARKGEEAIEELRWSSGNPGADFLRADLSLMTECDLLAVEVQARWPRPHYVIHSAGVIRGRRELTAEGLEVNFATNYLSRYALTQRLKPLLSANGYSDFSDYLLTGPLSELPRIARLLRHIRGLLVFIALLLTIVLGARLGSVARLKCFCSSATSRMRRPTA